MCVGEQWDCDLKYCVDPAPHVCVIDTAYLVGYTSIKSVKYVYKILHTKTPPILTSGSSHIDVRPASLNALFNVKSTPLASFFDEQGCLLNAPDRNVCNS